MEAKILKKLSCTLMSAVLVFAIASCSPQAEDTDTTESDTADVTSETELQAENNDDIPEDSAESVSPYENNAYNISMNFPAAWSAPQESDGDTGLTVLSSTEDFENSILILVRDIPAETPTLEEYKTSNANDLEELYDPAMITVNEIVSVNGTDFLKVVVTDTESHQIVYTAFANDHAYEIVFTLSPDYYTANASMVGGIENSIQIQ